MNEPLQPAPSHEAARCLDSLRRVLERESLEFEARAYGSPFIPLVDKDLSNRLYRRFCEGVTDLLSGDEEGLHHAWWVAAKKSEGRFQDQVRLHGFDDNEPHEKEVWGLKGDLLRDEVQPCASTGLVIRKQSETPYSDEKSDIILVAYLVFHDERIREGQDVLQSILELEDWRRDFLFVDTCLIRWDDADRDQAIRDWVALVDDREVYYQSYHAIFGPREGRLLADEAFLEAVKLHVMCFEREWGDREGTLRAQRDLAKRHAGAWAHEVKNYTGPLIRLLNRRSREGDPEIAWVLQGVLILNAVARAIQLGFGYKTQRGLAKHEGLRLLPREGAVEIVESVLQYLLNFQDKSSDHDEFTWDGRRDAASCIDGLCAALEQPATKRDDVLTRPEAIAVVAILREVVMNMRINEEEQQDRRIHVSYSITADGDSVRLELSQRNKESALERGVIEAPPGIKMSNDLFGAKGINLGHIDVLDARLVEESGSVRAFEGVDVEYRFLVRLRMDPNR